MTNKATLSTRTRLLKKWTDLKLARRCGWKTMSARTKYLRENIFSSSARQYTRTCPLAYDPSFLCQFPQCPVYQICHNQTVVPTSVANLIMTFTYPEVCRRVLTLAQMMEIDLHVASRDETGEEKLRHLVELESKLYQDQDVNRDWRNSLHHK